MHLTINCLLATFSNGKIWHSFLQASSTVQAADAFYWWHITTVVCGFCATYYCLCGSSWGNNFFCNKFYLFTQAIQVALAAGYVYYGLTVFTWLLCYLPK